MGKYLDIARKLEEQNASSLGSHVENLKPTTSRPVKSNGRLDFIDHLTETEREYYLNLVEIMQSPKFGMDLEAAQREAGRIIARNRQPLQIQQATQDYKKYGYCQIFSTVLDGPVYLARDREAAERVPDLNIPVYLESDIKAVKYLPSEEVKLLLEAKLLFGGPIKVEDYMEPPSQRRMNGKQIAKSFYSDERKINHE